MTKFTLVWCTAFWGAHLIMEWEFIGLFLGAGTIIYAVLFAFYGKAEWEQ